MMNNSNNDSVSMPIVWVYTFCYNEIDILPFVVQYWKQYAAHVIVYDNGSNDGSVEYMMNYPELIEIRTYNTNDSYDPERIQDMKNMMWKDTPDNVDWVMVCDMDEVLYPSQSLAAILNNALIYSTMINCAYYEGTSNVFPSYDGHTLLHEYSNVSFIYNEIIEKSLLFRPKIIKNINYSNYQRKCNPVGMVKFYEAPVQVFHLKMIGFNRSRMKHLKNISRCTITEKHDMINILYGYDNTTYSAHYNNIINSTKSNNWKKIQIDNRKEVQHISHNNTDVEWNDNIKLIHTDNHIVNNKCVVVIPVYKQYLADTEIASLRQCIKVLGDSYEIVLIYPENLYIEYYEYISSYKFSKVAFPQCYFTNTKTYSYLLEDYRFYKLFSSYRYMLIYQLDAWIFRDELKRFIKMQYDYIGSPWEKNMVYPYDATGNGGLSLRRISKFIKVCREADYSTCIQSHVDSEDLLFCIDLRDKFSIAPPNTAAEFGITSAMEYWINIIGDRLPMGCHAWSNYSYISFWKKYIEY